MMRNQVCDAVPTHVGVNRRQSHIIAFRLEYKNCIGLVWDDTDTRDFVLGVISGA